jgi:hypothetical protein
MSITADFTGGIAESRKKAIEDVNRDHRQRSVQREPGEELGLIDNAIYKEQVYEELKNRLGYKPRTSFARSAR